MDPTFRVEVNPSDVRWYFGEYARPVPAGHDTEAGDVDERVHVVMDAHQRTSRVTLKQAYSTAFPKSATESATVTLLLDLEWASMKPVNRNGLLDTSHTVKAILMSKLTEHTPPSSDPPAHIELGSMLKKQFESVSAWMVMLVCWSVSAIAAPANSEEINDH